MEKNILKTVPESPGVYTFEAKGQPIYIGKAINLKRRVSSYFDLNLEVKTARMVSEADKLSFIKVTSELEALLLEAKLINKEKPKYNSVAKDDKHPLYITITKEVYPRVITTRRNGSYGPFPSSTTVYAVLRMLRRIFPFSDHKIGKRPCIYSHMGLCDPCPNQITNPLEAKRYRHNIKMLKNILSGKIKNVRRNLENQMEDLSKMQNFEKAAEVRNQIKKLDYITQPIIPSDFYIENPNLTEDLRAKELSELGKIVKIKNLERIECYDVAHLAGTNPTASMVTFINGEPDKTFYKHFRIKKAKGGDDYEALNEVAKRRQNNQWGKPDLIIVDGGIGQVRAFKSNTPVVGIAKNPDRLIMGNEKIKLSGPALNLVQRMRNEAHRFARRYHHKLLAKNLLQ